jgi:hypothetical protein
VTVAKKSDVKKIRAMAVHVAKQALVEKYRAEYMEIYRAYCTEHGVGVRTLYEVDELPIDELEELQAS